MIGRRTRRKVFVIKENNITILLDSKQHCIIQKELYVHCHSATSLNHIWWESWPSHRPWDASANNNSTLWKAGSMALIPWKKNSHEISASDTERLLNCKWAGKRKGASASLMVSRRASAGDSRRCCASSDQRPQTPTATSCHLFPFPPSQTSAAWRPHLAFPVASRSHMVMSH